MPVSDLEVNHKIASIRPSLDRHTHAPDNHTSAIIHLLPCGGQRVTLSIEERYGQSQLLPRLGSRDLAHILEIIALLKV